jgi:hypothetical protein
MLIFTIALGPPNQAGRTFLGERLFAFNYMIYIDNRMNQAYEC